MTQHKGPDVSDRSRDKNGRFRDENKNPQPTPLPDTETVDSPSAPTYEQLLTATDVFDDPYEARRLEFDMPDGNTVSGYAVDGDRIDRSKVPAGWHAYSVMENDPSDDDSDETTMSIEHDGHVNHRMDFLTVQNLDSQIDSGKLSEIQDDNWGFTDDDLASDLEEQSGEYDFDLDIELEEKRHTMMDEAARDQIFFKPTPENMFALKAAIQQTVEHDERNHGESEIGDLRIAPSINPAALHLGDMTEEQITEARKYGGWNPERHKYVHFTQDGDLEGLSEKQADKLIWNNRQRIINAVRNDDSASMNTVNILHNEFNRQRQIKEQA